MRATVHPLDRGTDMNSVHLWIEEIVARAHFYHEGLDEVFIIIVARTKEQRCAAQCRGRQKHVANLHRNTSLKMKTNEEGLIANDIPYCSFWARKKAHAWVTIRLVISCWSQLDRFNGDCNTRTSVTCELQSHYALLVVRRIEVAPIVGCSSFLCGHERHVLSRRLPGHWIVQDRFAGSSRNRPRVMIGVPLESMKNDQLAVHQRTDHCTRSVYLRLERKRFVCSVEVPEDLV